MRFVLTGLSAAVILMLYAACAGARRGTRSGAVYFDVLEANVTRVMPGREESKPSTSGRVVLVWRSAVAPGALYLQPASGALLGPARVRRGRGASTVAADAPAVRSGDTLTLYFAETQAGLAVTPPLPNILSPSTMYFLVNGVWQKKELPMLQSKPAVPAP